MSFQSAAIHKLLVMALSLLVWEWFDLALDLMSIGGVVPGIIAILVSVRGSSSPAHQTVRVHVEQSVFAASE